MWYCPLGRGLLRRGGREYVQPDFARFVSVFVFGVSWEADDCLDGFPVDTLMFQLTAPTLSGKPAE
jgi:hypothetical protein